MQTLLQLIYNSYLRNYYFKWFCKSKALFFFICIISYFTPKLSNAQLVHYSVNESRDLYMFTLQNDSSLYLFLRNNKSFSRYTPVNSSVKKMEPHPNGKGFLILYDEGRFIYFDAYLESANLIEDSVTDFTISNNKIFLGDDRGEILVMGANDFYVKEKILSHAGGITALCANHSGTELAYATREGEINKINTSNCKLKKSTSIFTGEIIAMCYNESDDMLFAGTGVLFYALDKNLNGNSIVCNNFDFSSIKSIKENLVYFRRPLISSATTDQISRFVKSRNALYTNEVGFRSLGFHQGSISLWGIQNENSQIQVKFYQYSNDIEVLHYAGEMEFSQKCIDSISLDLSFCKNGNLKFSTQHDSIRHGIKAKYFTSRSPLMLKKTTSEDELEVIPQIGFAGPLKYLFFADSGRKVVTLTESPVVKIWDSKSMELIKEIRLPEFNVMKAALHPKLPLLVILDRNYQIHLIDLENFMIKKSFFYTKEKYNYVGDYDGSVEFDILMEFKFQGALLRIRSIEGGEDSFFLNAKTSDLLSGKIKPIKVNNEELYIQEAWDKRELLYKTDEEKRNYIASATTSYTLFQELREKDTIYFLIHVPSGKSTEIKDSIFYLDSLLKIPFNPSILSELPYRLYKKLKTPEVINLNIMLVGTSPEKRFLMLKNWKGELSVLNLSTMKPVLSNCETQVEFLSEKHGILLSNDTLFFTHSGKKVDLRKYFAAYYFGKNQKKFKRSIHFYRDSENDRIFLWTTYFENSWLIVDTKDESITLIHLPKPEIGAVKPSIFPEQSYLNYRTYFSRFDPLKLKMEDYWLQTVKENKNLSFNVYDKKPVKYDSIFFKLRQISFENEEMYSSSSPLSNYTLFNYVELIAKSNDFPANRILANPSTKEVKLTDCFKTDPNCYDGCYYDCKIKVNMFDSLSKIGFLGKNLTREQRSAFNKSTQLIRFRSQSRVHGKWAEYDYLEFYGIPIEYNNFDLNSCEDLIDSTLAANNDMLFALSFVNSLNGRKIKTFVPPPAGSYFMHFLSRKQKVLTYGYDGGIRLYDLKSKNDRETYTFFKSGSNHIFITSDHYYKLGGNGRSLMRFRKSGKVYGIEQFDLKLNRPDILLQRAGSTDTSLIQSYHRAYLKRLKKMGFTEDMLKDDYQLPEIIISTNNKIPKQTYESEIYLDLIFRDKKYLLDRVNVYVNDVPVYGLKGLNLRTEALREIKKNIVVPLVDGHNHVQISVLNQAGAESYKETWLIEKKSQHSSKPNLYIINIGAGKYLDSRFDLKYPAKDAQDINSYFNGEKEKLFSQIKSYVFTDEKVRHEEILSLKKELMKSNINDVVILTFAGHGVLNKNLDYYLATYDMNFSKPEENGIAFEELENLMDGIPPLRKLLLIDACHSGEVDKEEIELVNVHKTDSDIKFRSAGVDIQQRRMGLKSTSELVSELFTDLRKGTGATIISSSGGTEVSMESDQWRNGLFTYCLLKGLKSGMADLDYDGNILLSELQNYVIEEVTEKSKGTQRPSSRITNAREDFKIK